MSRSGIGRAGGWLGTLLVLAALLLLPGGPPAVGQEPPPWEHIPPEDRHFDTDGNRIVDSLDYLMAPAPPGQPFDVIVLFRRPLEESLPIMERAIGRVAVKHRYPSINGIATTLTRGQVIALAALDETVRIEYDAEVRALLDTATFWFGVQRIRLDFPGITGEGRAIAILDSGLDPDHLDLAGKIVAWQDFTSSPSPTPTDPDGHGTHVASIAAGTGAASGGLYQGVAPGADLVGLRVLGATGSGQFSWVNAAIQWAIDNKLRTPGTSGGDASDYGIEIMNLSLGAAGSSDGQSSTERLLNEAAAGGIVSAVSAGNEGPNKYTIGIPAAAERVITVGAMADVEPGPATAGLPGQGFYLAYFSSRGPTQDGRVKPDIAPPGVRVTAAEAGTTDGYVAYSGTSMSAPFVAGLAALLRHAGVAEPYGSTWLEDGTQVSDITDPVKTVIMSTAVPWGKPPYPNIDYGAGRLDAYAAMLAALGETGNNVRTPGHLFFQDSLGGTGLAKNHYFDVVTTFYPIAVTMVMDDNPTVSPPPGRPSLTPDFDIYLYDPGGTLLASGTGTARQETIAALPPVEGTYRLEVRSYRGSGGYIVDISAGTEAIPPPGILLTTDGSLAFGVLAPSATATSSDDVQRVKVDLGPAGLYLRTTLFTAGDGHSWSLGTTAGEEQVEWGFSADGGGTWTTFTTPGEVFLAASGLRDGQTLDLLFRLTMPTYTVSKEPHMATVTIVAVAPD